MKCFVCGNIEKFTPLFPKFCSAKNYLCNSCGLVFIPRGGKPSVREYYKDDGYFKKSPNLGFRKIFFSKSLFTKLAEERIAEMKKVLADVDLKGKILDVGCGYGHILYVLKKHYGCEVLGIEPSQEAAKAGEEAFGIPIKPVLLEEFNFDSKFDLVLCSHTLEHVEDPLAFLNHIRNLLKDDGFLYLEVPNILRPTGGFSLEKFLYPEHLQTFSAYNLNELLKKCSFSTVSYDDKNFLRFVCAKQEVNQLGVAKVSSGEILEFLEGYKRTYGLREHFRVYLHKFIYLLKILRYRWT